MACDQPGCAYELGGPGSAAACGRLLKLRSRLVPARPGHSPDRAGRFAGTTCATAKAGEPGWVFPARAATRAPAAAGEPLQRPCDTLAPCRARVGPQFDSGTGPLICPAKQAPPAAKFHELGMAANEGKRPGGLVNRRRVSCGKTAREPASDGVLETESARACPSLKRQRPQRASEEWWTKGSDGGRRTRIFGCAGQVDRAHRSGPNLGRRRLFLRYTRPVRSWLAIGLGGCQHPSRTR